MVIAVTVQLALLALAVSCVSAQDGCFSVNPGSRSIADVCSRLLDKLQLAVIRDPTNMYLIKKVWSDPVPSIVHVVYDVNISNKSATSCARTDNDTELANNSLTFHGSLWTDRGLFTLIHPGVLQQLQLQFPYIILQLATGLTGGDLPFGSFVLSAILWNGCESSTETIQGLPNVTLLLNVDDLPCTPSKRQLETSLVELTAWLRAYENLQPHEQNNFEVPNLDIEKRKFFFYYEFTVTSSSVIFVLIALPGFFCLFWAMLLGVKQLLKRTVDSELHTKQLFTPTIVVVATWNVLILLTDINSFNQCPPSIHNSQAFKLALFLSIFCVIPILGIITHRFHPKLESDLQNLKLSKFTQSKFVAKLLFVFAMWNVFVFITYFYISVMAALLLAYVYPFQVIAVSSFLMAGVVFNILLFSLILPSIPKYAKRVNSIRDHLVVPNKLSLETVCKVVVYVFYVIVVLLINVVLLSLFGAAILRGLVSDDSVTGKFISLLPAIVLGFASYLLKHNMIAEKETMNKPTQTSPTDNQTQMTDLPLEDGTHMSLETESPVQAESIPVTKSTEV